MVEIKVLHTLLERHTHLPSANAIFVAIHDGPNGFAGHGPAAGEDAEPMHWIERLPIPAPEKWSHTAFNSRHLARSLSIAGSYAVPDPPNIFPTLPTLAVKKSELQVVRLIAIPAALDIHLVPWFQPTIAVHGRHELELILPPGQHIPRDPFIVRAAFRFEGERMPYFFCS